MRRLTNRSSRDRETATRFLRPFSSTVNDRFWPIAVIVRANQELRFLRAGDDLRALLVW